MNNIISDLIETDTIESEPFIGFCNELKTAMTQYQEKNNLTIREYSNRAHLPSHVILAIKNGLLLVQDVPLSQLISLYKLHKNDMKHYTMKIVIEYKE